MPGASICVCGRNTGARPRAVYHQPGARCTEAGVRVRECLGAAERCVILGLSQAAPPFIVDRGCNAVNALSVVVGETHGWLRHHFHSPSRTLPPRPPHRALGLDVLQHAVRHQHIPSPQAAQILPSDLPDPLHEPVGKDVEVQQSHKFILKRRKRKPYLKIPDWSQRGPPKNQAQKNGRVTCMCLCVFVL